MLKKSLFFLLASLALWVAVSIYSKPLHKEPEERVTPPMDRAYEHTQAYYLLNALRSQMQMQRFATDSALEKAAHAHASYLVDNREESHFETEGMPGFTGTTHSERALKSGYLSKLTSENLSTKNPDAQSSIDGLFSAIYHRFGFLDPAMDEIGIGIVQDPKDSRNTAFVYVMGNSNLNRLCQRPSYQSSGKFWRLCKDESKRIWDKDYTEAIAQIKRYNPKIITYPYANQEDVPPVFYQEEPDPLPDYDVSGFPVSIQFNDHYFKKVTLHAFNLYDPDGNPVESRLLDEQSDPNQRLSGLQYALMPLKRLAYDSRYKAEIIYNDRGKEQHLVWYFHTRKFDEPFFRIDENTREITIRPNSSNILYFPPRNGHNLIKDLSFPSSVYLEFVDHNTVRLTVDAEASDDFTIRSDSRELDIRIED